MDEQTEYVDEQPFHCEVIQHSNCAGIDIVEYAIEQGVPPKGFARFRMQVTLVNDAGQPLMVKVMPVDAATIGEAFAIAPGVMADAQPEMEEKLKDEIEKQQGADQAKRAKDARRIMTPAEARALAAANGGNRQQRRAEASLHNRMKGNF